jgi:hypothetical protein
MGWTAGRDPLTRLWFVVDEGGWSVANNIKNETTATLIAAAPEMEKMLRDALPELDEGCGCNRCGACDLRKTIEAFLDRMALPDPTLKVCRECGDLRARCTGDERTYKEDDDA